MYRVLYFSKYSLNIVQATLYIHYTMNFDVYRTPSADRIRLYLSLLAMLLLTAIFGKKRPEELNVSQSLQKSAFTRIMFMDIGVLSTLGALYLILNGQTSIRIPAAIASLFFGGFALLPALAYEDYIALQNKPVKPSS